MAPISAKMTSKDALKHHLKTRQKKDTKRHSNKTCLSKGTGSAFKEESFAQHVLNNSVNLNDMRERERERKSKRERDYGIPKEYLRNI